MNRRQFVIGVGSVGAIAAGATGSGAFSFAELNNDLKLDNAARDVDGFVALAPAGEKITDGGKAIAADGSYYDPDASGAPSYINGRIIDVNGDGSIVIDLNGNGDTGFNHNSVYYFDNALQVYIQKKNDLVTYTDGPWEVSFSSLPVGVEAYNGASRSPDFSATLAANEGALVGFKVDASQLSSSPNNSLTAQITAELV